MTIARLKELQNIDWRVRTDAERTELEQLGRELALDPELPDDPTTPFTDESSRPDVVHGGNYNDALHRMTCAELEAIGKRIGRVAFDAAVAAIASRF